MSELKQRRPLIKESFSDTDERPSVGQTATVQFSDVFSPSFKLAFCALALIRHLSAHLNIMSDCDEVFNYWEPAHYTVFGYGLQTWEYSPEFALRSYAYAGVHGLVSYALSFLVESKIGIFFLTRSVLGIACAYAEAYFYQSVVMAFGARVGNFTLFFLAVSAGMFQAGPAFLPNSFAMVCFLIGIGAWYRVQTPRSLSASDGLVCVGAVSCAALVGTPFVVVMAVPIAFHLLFVFGLWPVLRWAIGWSALWLGLSLVVDWQYYGFPTCPIFNTLVYNAIGSGPGSQLYGVEPASYYIKNLFLNFNIVFILAALAPTVCGAFGLWSEAQVKLGRVVKCSPNRCLLYLSPMLFWLTIMFKLEHKEERFLFPIYPLICLSAAVTLVAVRPILNLTLRPIVKLRSVSPIWKLLCLVVCSAFALASVSRIVSMQLNYGAPTRVWSYIYENVTPKGTHHANVCVGKEWYRFPSSYFIPSGNVMLQYVKSDFTGQLPQYYFPPPNGTRIVPSYFNDKNVGDESAFIDIRRCDYFVDFEPQNQKERPLSKSPEWTVEFTDEFLDASASPSIFRAFYVPWLSRKHSTFSPYLVLRRNNNK